jgi:hypothetical protein
MAYISKGLNFVVADYYPDYGSAEGFLICR